MLTGALFGAVFVRHAPICYPLAIALVTIVLGAVDAEPPLTSAWEGHGSG